MTLERRTLLIGRVLAALLILVSLRAAYWQLWRGLTLQPVALDPVRAARRYAQLRGDPTPLPGSPDTVSLVQLPQPVIQRTVQLLSTIERGTIYDRHGNVLAQDQGRPGDYTRVYADPSLVHTLGYVSAIRTGVSGLEATYNRTLLGLDRPDTEIDQMLHRPIHGSSIVLTIDSRVQQAAVEAQQGWAGAIVAMDAKTGAILAMTSAPYFDPNRVNEEGYMGSLQGSSILINRATQGMFTPGSTFKTVTLIAALDTRQIDERTVFDFGEPKRDANGKIFYTYEVGGGVIYDPNHEENRLNLEQTYYYSANAAYAKLADQMPPNVFIEYAERFGFDDPNYTRRFPLELPVAVPQLANDVEEIRTNNLLRASTGYGQGELLTTPLNMAMIVSAVVNEGSIPVPYLVESVRDPQGNVIRTQPNKHTERGLMSPQTARIVKKYMVSVVDHLRGGQDAMVPGATSGGKTGTAQLGGDVDPHLWFVGFTERGEQRVIVAAITENGGGATGHAVLPIFAKVAGAALNAMENPLPAQPQP